MLLSEDNAMKKLLIVPALALLLAATAAWAADGEKIYKDSCAGCHGMAGEKGNSPLKDQDADTVLKKLQGYVDGTYGGEKKAVMVNIAKKHEAELKDIADYIGAL